MRSCSYFCECAGATSVYRRWYSHHMPFSLQGCESHRIHQQAYSFPLGRRIYANSYGHPLRTDLLHSLIPDRAIIQHLTSRPTADRIFTANAPKSHPYICRLKKSVNGLDLRHGCRYCILRCVASCATCFGTRYQESIQETCCKTTPR